MLCVCPQVHLARLSAAELRVIRMHVLLICMWPCPAACMHIICTWPGVCVGHEHACLPTDGFDVLD